MTQSRPPSVTAVLIASLAAATAAEPVVAPQPPAGDEIMLFSELPEVVSASRQKTSLSGATVAISVVQAEQLHADRLRSLPEVLRRLPGMDVLDIDRGHVAVGVRGLHGLFSDRTLVLLDGVPFENVSLGGADWHRLPVGVGNLERIEVVRGPASAAWGANALNGVINLITAPPEDRLGTSVTVGADQWGDALGAISIAELSGQTAWRLSGGYRDLRSSAETADVDSSAGDDAVRTGRVAIDLSTPTALGALTAMAGWAGGEVGSYEFIGYDPNRPVRIDSLRSQIRLNSGGRDDALATSVILHGHYDRVLEPQLVDRGETWRIGTTAQVDIDGGMGHRVTLGCDGDTTRVSYTTGDDREEFTFGGPFQEWRVGLFGIDRWNLGSGFTSELQLRGERYTGTGNDWGGRATILYDVAGDQRHVLRVGGARAYRTPYPSLRQGVANRGWINVPGFGSLSVIGLRPDPGGA